jgi:hypothetical protein
VPEVFQYACESPAILDSGWRRPALVKLRWASASPLTSHRLITVVIEDVELNGSLSVDVVPPAGDLLL